MQLRRALQSGLIGASALTLLHETARRAIPNPPRMDVIGMRALARSMRQAGQRPPERDQLYWLALAGDLLSNSAYYSLVGLGDPQHHWRRGVLLGLLAGIGAVLLPPAVGLGRQPEERSPLTQTLTIAWYLAGGLAAAAANGWLAEQGQDEGHHGRPAPRQRPGPSADFRTAAGQPSP